MKKKLIVVLLLLMMLVVFSACRQLDVIGNGSVEAFDALSQAMPAVYADEVNGGWLLIAPDDSTRFFWSKDFSQSRHYDVAIEFDPQPFIDAGLDLAKLPQEMIYGDKLRAGNVYGDKTPTYNGEITPLASYEQILLLYPGKIAYHDAADHYMLHFGNGNMIEFAKDMSTNEKDIVFMLNPQPFIEAGVDPQLVEGWTFVANLETMNASGKTVVVDRFLKIFDLQ